MDIVLVVNELLKYAKRSKKRLLVLKEDFEKAYDSVSWSFIDYMLRRLGFNDVWWQWMRGCYTTNFISVCIIGSLTNELQALRGLKQGDCFVPFLFTVVVEGMPGLMHKAE